MKHSGYDYLIKEGFRNIWNNRIMSMASVGVLVSCLILTGAAVMLSINVSSAVESVGDSNVTTVYLTDEVTELEAKFVGEKLKQIENVESCEFYSKEQAILDYKETLGEEIFENVLGEDNPLPHAFRITMKDLSKYSETVKKIEEISEVSSVGNRQQAAKILTDLNKLIGTLSFWIILILTIISLFIISNTIRITMYSRRFEVSIMKSVGATDAFVRLPFLVEGMIIGFVSGIISVYGLMLIYNSIIRKVTEVLYMPTVPYSSVAGIISVLFILSGMFVGAIGAFISIRRYLKLEGNELLGW